jgi:hypothetical protein
MQRLRSLAPVLFVMACAPRAPLDPERLDARADPPPMWDALTDASIAIDHAEIEGDTGTALDAPDAPALVPDAMPDATPDAAHDIARDGSADGGRALRVLFVGNSYTSVNDLPSILVRMAARARPAVTMTAESVLVGGATLRTHWESSGAQGRLRGEPWDAVVLQGQSVEPLWQPEVFAAHADRFGALARERDVRPLWFATWARRADSDVYAERWSGGAVDAMTVALERGYASARARNGGALARVGEAWRRSLAMRPSLTLHDGDGSHPTIAGSYLAACVLYLALVGEPLPDAPDAVMGLAVEDTAALRSTALAVWTAP